MGKLKAFVAIVLLLAFSTVASAESRLIVRYTLGESLLKKTCSLLGCTVLRVLDGDLGQLFLVAAPDLNNSRLLYSLRLQLGVTNVEFDQEARILQASSSGAPPALYDRAPVQYYGATVWNGYVNQPAAQIIRVQETHRAFGVRGAGTVAVIDTGVDPTHPVLRNALVAGYDFTRDREGIPAEQADVNQSTAAVLDGAGPVIVNQSTAAVLDQSTAAVLDDRNYAAFGHGTMVAGVIHMVAPRAAIMPLKAFKADGSGQLSDILRAVYYAVRNNAKVINMSFSTSSYSRELSQATVYAMKKGVISVASAGNDGRETMVYPAGYQNTVIGVASTDNYDRRSSFSNYGPSLVWVAAPGEAIVTTYPFGTYAAAWGTSFSTPMVAGAAALLVDVYGTCNESQAAQALANAKRLTAELNKGRLDLYRAVQAWRNITGQ
jgi:subtilisin family serine protease